MWRQGICRGALLVTLTPGTLFVGVLLAGLDEGAAAEPAIATPVRAHCSAPRTLRLRRFEDHSAQLLCGRRVIVRISVPG
ncbi:MAG: hypothetical protein QOE75_1694 [Solirubrobacterales bacterium]|jgi:hypothetical protein|nr:hypothetical protein [Solirubrobacterales bacterium]